MNILENILPIYEFNFNISSFTLAELLKLYESIFFESPHFHNKSSIQTSLGTLTMEVMRQHKTLV